jgi:hypothetical protein
MRVLRLVFPSQLGPLVAEAGHFRDHSEQSFSISFKPATVLYLLPIIARKVSFMRVSQADNSEVSILNRILRPKMPTFSPEAAEDILNLDFDPVDKDRMRQLSAKARAGTLTANENAEMSRYELVGHLLNIMQSKARRSLKSGRNDKKKPRIH